MKILALLFPGLLLLGMPSVGTAQVNGVERYFGEQRTLVVWGTPYEMGYAQGIYFGESVMDVVYGYALNSIPMEMFTTLRALAKLMIDFPSEFREEAEGYVAGMREAGVNLYVEELGRELDDFDLLMANLLVDTSAFGCSSVSAWGGATADDPLLAGETALGRNLDWTRGPDDVLPRNTVVVGYLPSDPGKRPLVNIAFPGFIGCLTCMAESGVVAELNLSFNGAFWPDIQITPRFDPINLTMRKALEDLDPNEDGVHSIEDLADAVSDSKRLAPTIIMAVQPNDNRSPAPGFVIENDNTGVMLRHAGEAVFTDDDILLATNHFFLLDEPYSCSRITALLGYLMDHGQLLDLDDFWTMMQLVGGYYTIQTFRFVPRDLSLEVAFTDGPLLAPDKTPTSIAWDDLFSAVPPADDDDDNDDNDNDDNNDDNDNDDNNNDDNDDSSFIDASTPDDDDDGCGC